MNSNITNRNLGDISWRDSSGFDFIHPHQVDVWRINVGAHLTFLNDFLSIMSFEEIVKARRFYQIKDRNRYIIGRGAIRNILAKYVHQLSSAIRFQEDINKKPFLISFDKDKLFHNVSYSGDWVLIAVANSEIGVDIEWINPNFSFREMIHYAFSEEEINYIDKGLSIEPFFLLWTRKEALVKATGKGLDNNLKLIPCLNGMHSIQSDLIFSTNDWLINSFDVDDRHIASVATGPLINVFRYFEYNV